MKKLFLFILLLCSQFLSAQDNAINRAIVRFDYHTALQLLAKEKPSANTDMLKAQCYKNLMEYDKAILIYEHLLQIDSLNPQLLNGLADLYQTTGRFYKSDRIYRNLLQLQPDNRYFSLALTGNLYKMKDWEQTLAELRKNLKTDSLPQLLSMAGDCFWQLDNNDSAVHYYQKTLTKAPDDYNTTVKLARIYLQTQKYEALTSCTNAYIRVDSTNKSVNQYNGIGHCYLQQYDSAIYQLKRIYNSGDKTFTTTFFLGSSYYGRQDYYEAYDHLTEAYEKDSTNLNLIYYLGRSAISTGRFAKGTAVLERGLQLMTPKDTVLYNYYQNLATGYSRWEKPTMAMEYYAKSLKIIPESKLTVYKMATLADYALKNHKQALLYYNQFLSMFPKETESGKANFEEEIKGSYYSAVKNRIQELKDEEFFKRK